MNLFSRSWGWLDPVRRLWWLPVVIGVLAGLAVGSFTTATSNETTSAVVNTRAGSTLPNERVDLINDLIATSKLSSVTNPVARANGLTGAELRTSLRVERIETSTLAQITLTTDQGDEDFRREVVSQFLESVQDYLVPEGPTPSFQAAQRAETAAIDAYYQALADNGGMDPTVTFERLQTNLVNAQRAKNKQLQQSLRSFVPRASKKAAEFEKIERRRDRAVQTLKSLGTTEITSAKSGPAALKLSFLTTERESGLTDSVPLRRGVAAGLAAALVVAGLLLLLARGRRLT